MSRGGKRRERPHKPGDLGPRLFRRGRWYGADLRPWSGGRVTLRDPKDPDWPDGGDRTEDPAVADRWKWAYSEMLQDATRRRQLGLPPVGRALGRAVEDWLVLRERTVAEGTVRNNSPIVRRLVEHFGAERSVRSITTAELQKMFSRLIRAGYAPTTLAVERTVMGTFFRWATEGEYNPARKVELADVIRGDIHTWTDAELESIRAAADRVDAQRKNPPSCRLAVELALATGGRQQELFALDWSAVNEKARTVRFTRQLSRGGKRFVPLKGKHNRTALILPAWWDWNQPASGLILPNADGSPYDYRAATHLVQRILDTAGVNGPGRGWHDFRRTYGRLFLEKGGWMDELQRSLGHKSIRTTEASYGHFAEDKAAEFARARIYGEGRLRIVRP